MSDAQRPFTVRRSATGPPISLFSEPPGIGYYTDARKRSSVSRILPNLGRCPSQTFGVLINLLFFLSLSCFFASEQRRMTFFAD